MALFINGTGSPFAVGTNPVSNATADLNGDGKLDLLTANYISDNVTVLFGDGAGVFGSPAAIAVGNGPRQIQVGDLDGDGDIDFVVSNYASNDVSVALNNGNGTFAVAVGVPTGGTVTRYVSLADLDGDGDLDMVTANYSSNNVSVLLNNGHGVFAAAIGSPIPVGTRPVGVTLGDFDGDHDNDIAVTNNSSNNATILLNNGSASFSAASGSPVATGAGPRDVASGDVDRDGDLDLVVGNFSANNLSILLNDGAGHFTAAATPPLVTGNNPYRVILADLDGDRDLDIAVSNSGSSSVSAFINNGRGTFTPADSSPFGVGVSPGGVIAGDFDKDGFLDLATANFGSNSTSILLNTLTRFDGTSAPDSLTPSAGNLIVAGGAPGAKASDSDTITFNFRLVDATFSFQDDSIVVDGPSTHVVLRQFERFIFTDGTVDNRDSNQGVNDLFYYSQNHDVWNAHADANVHYAIFGWHEGRDPNAFFSTTGYLAKYTDVAAAGVNPLEHYHTFGFKEGRDPSKLFDTAAYLAQNPDVAAAHVDPLLHFLIFGYEEGRHTSIDGVFAG